MPCEWRRRQARMSTDTARGRRPPPPHPAGSATAARPDGTLRSPASRLRQRPVARRHGLGVTLRSPLRTPGSAASTYRRADRARGDRVLTADDVRGERLRPGARRPAVLASEFSATRGSRFALVAADHPETARRAARRIRVDYEVLPPSPPRRAMDDDAPAVHRPQPGRHLPLRRGDRLRRTGRRLPRLRGRDQDQAFLGRSPGSPYPPRTAASTCTCHQWLHVTTADVLALGMPPEKVRLHLPGSAARSAAGRTCRSTARSLLALRTAARSRCPTARGVLLRARAPHRRG